MRRQGSGIVARSEESITRMTPYRLPHHGNRSFAAAQDDILRLSSPQRQTLHIRLGWQLTIFLATSVQILHVRSGWRLTLSSLWRLTVPDHSEWGQECCLRKTGNGTVTRSEESITRMTSYRLPHHGNRSFTFVQDDDWRFPHYDALPSPVILNGRKNAV